MANIKKHTGRSGVVSYTIRVYRGRDTDGKQLKPYIKTYTPEKGMTAKQIEKEVNRVATLFEEECKKGTVSTERKTFSEYAEYVIEQKDRSGVKHKTIVLYRSLLDRVNNEDFCGFGYMKIKNIRAEHLNNFYTALGKEGANKRTGKGLSAKSIIEHHRFISVVLQQAFKEQLVNTNVAKLATPPKLEKREAECLTIEDIQNIMHAIESESLMWKTLTHMFIATGARRGEILGLKWSDIDFTTNQLHLCNNLLYTKERGIYTNSLKTGESRYVTVAKEVAALLKAWRAEQGRKLLQLGTKNEFQGHVFTQWNGRPMHPDSVTDYYAKLSKRYEGLPKIHPHIFRHTQASILIANGVDVVAVSKRLGHAKVSTTTDIYAHLIKKADERASDTIAQVLYKAE
ncbi:MAG: site-specific integrase [Ruminococcaceae bacterium]|nr:site-specific integrase [Oscillospiraceae bacterium]